MTRLIGFGGYKESGKDAAADHLVERHGWVKLGMSDALVDAALVLDPWVPVNTRAHGQHREDGLFTRLSGLVREVGYVAAKRNPEFRRFLQVLGTEVGRKMIHEDVWVDIIRERIQDARRTGSSVAVTGIRYRNEIRAIERLNGRTVWVHRPEVMPPLGTDLHDSEVSLGPDDFDEVLLNIGTLSDLRVRVDQMLEAVSPVRG